MPPTGSGEFSVGVSAIHGRESRGEADGLRHLIGRRLARGNKATIVAHNYIKDGNRRPAETSNMEPSDEGPTLSLLNGATRRVDGRRAPSRARAKRHVVLETTTGGKRTKNGTNSDQTNSNNKNQPQDHHSNSSNNNTESGQLNLGSIERRAGRRPAAREQPIAPPVIQFASPSPPSRISVVQANGTAAGLGRMFARGAASSPSSGNGEPGGPNELAARGPHGARATSLALVVGLPILGCITLAMLLCYIYHHWRRLNSSRAAQKGQSQAQSRHQLDVGPAGAHSPVGFISGGKVIEGLRSSMPILGQASAEDSRQLTLDMEGNSTDSCGRQADSRKSKASVKSKAKQKQKQEAHLEQIGRIKYKIDYDFNRAILFVTVIQASNLPGLDLSGTSDPYVKVYLVPDKRRCEKTRTHWKTLEPIFNETFQFPVPYADLIAKTLVLAVYDYDRFSRHDEIGQVSIPIGSLDLAQTRDEWAELKSITDSNSGQVSGLDGTIWKPQGGWGAAS